MSMIIIDGVDRTGKSTIADSYKDKGYEVVHMSAPDKKYTQSGYTGPSYADDIVEMYLSHAGRDVVFDRSPYGEFVWSKIYNRTSLLSEDDIEMLAEIENNNDVERYLMFDPNTEAHWKRCVENNEPLTRQQFNGATQLFESFSARFGFHKLTLQAFMANAEPSEKIKDEPEPDTLVTQVEEKSAIISGKTEEQLKLEKANAINDILSKKILKRKGNVYEDIEGEIRVFLNDKLASIFGSGPTYGFSNEDVEVLTALCNKMKSKVKQENK